MGRLQETHKKHSNPKANNRKDEKAKIQRKEEKMKSGQTHLYLIVKDSEITPEKGGQSLVFGVLRHWKNQR